MPKYHITIQRTVHPQLLVEVVAETEAEAREKVWMDEYDEIDWLDELDYGDIAHILNIAQVGNSLEDHA